MVAQKAKAQGALNLALASTLSLCCFVGNSAAGTRIIPPVCFGETETMDEACGSRCSLPEEAKLMHFVGEDLREVLPHALDVPFSGFWARQLPTWIHKRSKLNP